MYECKRRRRNRNIILGTAFAAGAGAAAYVIYRCMCTKPEEQKCEYEDENIKVIRSAKDALLSKIGATHSEIEEAKRLNRTAFDIAKDKGFSEEQLKMFINHDRFIAIDELVLNRKISAEIGEHVKEKIKEHTDNWDGRIC
jgi:hypothetical protein